MHITLSPNIIAPFAIVFALLTLYAAYNAILGTFDRAFCEQPKCDNILKHLWYNPFSYMLTSFTGAILLLVIPALVITHPIPMKNFDDHVTVQGRNITIDDLPKAYSLYSASGDTIDNVHGEYRDGKLIVDGAEYELTKSDIKYLDKKVQNSYEIINQN